AVQAGSGATPGIASYDFAIGRGDDLSDVLCDADILINATPLGMEGVSAKFLHFDFLKKLPRDALVYDLIYRPAETELLAAAKTLGMRVVNGLGMLVYQGLLADELFLNRAVDREALFGAILEELSETTDGVGLPEPIREAQNKERKNTKL
ncbi:MAG: hypothetical protein LBL63_03360, partial [Clostridiales Family XIII bacterium]|nr:hypothetical protein [Clostridiales Family XIII bacterium]